MDVDASNLRSPSILINRHSNGTNGLDVNGVELVGERMGGTDLEWEKKKRETSELGKHGTGLRNQPILLAFLVSLFFFMHVEYTHRMVPSSSPPLDFGFIATAPLNRMLASHPDINNLLAGLNTVFLVMQLTYILRAWLIEDRPRAAISLLFMLTCRGILGYLTQLPLPEDFLGSSIDFPVANSSFFLFFSGHVAMSVIASKDMLRLKRSKLAFTFQVLNLLQIVRLLSTRGHYTIDLVVGFGAGILFYSLAEKYEEYRDNGQISLLTLLKNSIRSSN